MKKIMLLHTAALLVILGSSCVTSLQPLVTADKMITDDRIVGIWTGNNNTFRIERMQRSDWYNKFTLNKTGPGALEGHIDSAYISNAYGISFEEDGVTYHMRAGLTRIDNSLYLDATPLAIYDPSFPDGSGFEWNYSYLPTISVARLEMTHQNNLTIIPANGDFVKEQIMNNRVQVKHESDALTGTLLITASSAELRQFVQKYGHDERLFSSKNSITLTRKG
jgi:hypothetical protein